MSWKEDEHTFYTRIFETEPFKIILGSDFDLTPIEYYAKPMAINMLRHILNPNFDEKLRDKCLKGIGETCCQMFLEYGDIETETDIDKFISNLEKAFQGHRLLKRRGNLVYDELDTNGQCGCPIICGSDIKPEGSIWCMCSKHAREALFGAVLKRPVQAELLDSPLYTGSDTCRWLIRIESA